MKKNKLAVVLAVLAAALYAGNVPASKILLKHVTPTMLAGFLYLGAGVGMGVILLCQLLSGKERERAWLDRGDLPYTVAMVVLDIAAPVLLMFGIARTSSANVSLMNNFEIVATTIIALAIFKEKVSRRLWGAILLVTAATAILGFEGTQALTFNRGSLYVLGACICWGVENNCTRSISDKSAEEIVFIKGIFSGLGGILTALILGESFPGFIWILGGMALGFASYGLSINCYIRAQKELGAARTSAFYSVAPFLGAGGSFLLLGERPNFQFGIAFLVMAGATWLMIRDTLGAYHGYVHTHSHHHGNQVHTHAHRHYVFNPMHIHSHSHDSWRMQQGQEEERDGKGSQDECHAHSGSE